MNENGEPWFERCEDCNCDTFWVRVTPIGECATENDWICTECGGLVGGVISDPLNELPSIPLSEFNKKGENNAD